MNMKIQNKQTGRASRGFTLIEMIGVLAIIAILAALLVPKIFESISNARINNAAVSYNTVKTAIIDHYAKYGSLLSSNGVVISNGDTNFDRILLSEGFLDKPFAVKIGNAAHVEAVATVSAATAVTTANSAYDLDGDNSAVNDVVGSTVIQAVIFGVTEGDAHDLSDRLDGATLTVPINTAGGDVKGRVKYAAPSGGTTTVYIYCTHR